MVRRLRPPEGATAVIEKFAAIQPVRIEQLDDAGLVAQLAEYLQYIVDLSEEMDSDELRKLACTLVDLAVELFKRMEKK